jgi:hypothetical protein
MKFKIEICLLGLAIAFFTISMFFFGYQAGNGTFSLWTSYPYREYALPIVGFGSALMVAATVSYTKRSKNMI